MAVVSFSLAFRQDTLNLALCCASTSSFLLRDSLGVVRWVRLMVGSTAVGPAPGVFCCREDGRNFKFCKMSSAGKPAQGEAALGAE